MVFFEPLVELSQKFKGNPRNNYEKCEKFLKNCEYYLTLSFLLLIFMSVR